VRQQFVNIVDKGVGRAPLPETIIVNNVVAVVGDCVIKYCLCVTF